MKALKGFIRMIANNGREARHGTAVAGRQPMPALMSWDDRLELAPVRQAYAEVRVISSDSRTI